jgi:hypothetical protein
MIKKSFHILVIAILALNLMGAWAFASAFDCGMECCKPGDWAGTISYEAPSCCQMTDVTCGFEAGQYEELFDTAICCHSGLQKIGEEWDLNASWSIFSPSPALPLPPSEGSTGPPQSTPVYLSNAAFLC